MTRTSFACFIMPSRDKIMIVGGYGQVGQLIAQRLAPSFPARLVIAGRNVHKAEKCAARIGYSAIGRFIDVFSQDVTSALDDIALVVVCMDQHDTHFVTQCLTQGVHYLDLSANERFLARVEGLDSLAKRTAATGILSVGVTPGLSNLLSAHAKIKMDRVARLDIFIQLGLGDHHGEAAIAWLLDNLDAIYDVREEGRSLSVQSFRGYQQVRFPKDRSERSAYRFNFSDQHVLARTLQVPSVSTWLCFDNRLTTFLFAMLVRIGLGRLLHKGHWRKNAIRFFRTVHFGSDICAVVVQATGGELRNQNTFEFGVVGRSEALMTAIVAGETVRQVLSMEKNPGVFHSEQIIVLEPMIAALRKEIPGLVVQI